LLLQPFVNYNLPDHWYLVSGPVMTANWAAKTGDIWTVPLGGGVGKLLKLGQILPLEGHKIANLPFTTEIQAYGLVARPDDGAKWQLRFQLNFLFPDRAVGKVSRVSDECRGWRKGDAYWPMLSRRHDHDA
jgi:hypothetical protein